VTDPGWIELNSTCSLLGGDGAILRACITRPPSASDLGCELWPLGILGRSDPRRIPRHVPLLQQRQFRIVEHLMF